MNDMPDQESGGEANPSDLQARREFLQSLGKWSGAAIVAAVGAGWLGTAPEAGAAWINRRGGVRGGGWINGAGWVNRAGGWINGGGGGGGWINRRGVQGGTWVNRR